MALSLQSTTRPPSAAHSEKRVHEMNRLSDVGFLPASVFWIMGINSALTIAITYLVHKNHWELYFMLFWLTCIVGANLLPVVVARLLRLRRISYYPTVSQVKLLTDFYKLSDWVYLLPIMNIGFWVVFSWIFLTYRNTLANALILSVTAFFCTLLPLFIRMLFSFWNGTIFASK